MVFRKKLRSLERRWEKISKFLGDLPSEQIFYRNIPLGALGRCLRRRSIPFRKRSMPSLVTKLFSMESTICALV